jgi:hypothetical protein
LVLCAESDIPGSRERGIGRLGDGWTAGEHRRARLLPSIGSAIEKVATATGG